MPNTKIVQEWQTTEWPDKYPPSRMEMHLRDTKDGCVLTMKHSAVPAEQADDYDSG